MSDSEFEPILAPPEPEEPRKRPPREKPPVKYETPRGLVIAALVLLLVLAGLVGYGYLRQREAGSDRTPAATAQAPANPATATPSAAAPQPPSGESAPAASLADCLAETDQRLRAEILSLQLPPDRLAIRELEVPNHPQVSILYEYTLQLEAGTDLTRIRDGLAEIAQSGFAACADRLELVRSNGTVQVKLAADGTQTHRITLQTWRPPQPEPTAGPRLAIMFDDLGNRGSLDVVDTALGWDVPITFAILPRTPYAAELADKVHAAGKEVMLHQPMEPYKYPQINPGPGALLFAQSLEESVEIFKENLDRVPHVVGVNNHMGSRYSETAERMDAVLRVIAQRNLFFLDSRTSSKTVAYDRAIAMGVPSANRDAFLDDKVDPDFMASMWARGIKRAKAHGRAVIIAHPHRETLQWLDRKLETLDQSGVQPVFVSQVVSVK